MFLTNNIYSFAIAGDAWIRWRSEGVREASRLGESLATMP